MASAAELHRTAHDLFNRRDWDAMRALVADDIEYTDHPRATTVRGFDDFVTFLQSWVTGMSDARIDDARYHDAGGVSVGQFRGRGVNDGQFGPANATGKALDLPFCELLRVEGDRIRGGELYYDTMTMLVQFGLAEAPAAA
jgi:steroid delta-isomerase-like uncharacterized protein